ncbi:hypothetical protein PR202_ga26430 [Eleusine coracana subsp. coracana]|uniref:Possible tRNA binding domain-containing protein n=1 Tax=Eleusine coracana subsp. coracana TaxID=191504 RepID=A0AAV5DBX1_ELECO|nr:hypothetical protein PR202_ga26430 [Eleusine coracana subsp. coracana]
MKSLSEGRAPSGDQIPWKFCEQFQDNLGYGSAAVDLLTRYYEGQMTLFADDEEETEETEVKITEAAEKSAVTGEHTCMVLRPLNTDDIQVKESSKCGFLDPFYQAMCSDFRQRFRRLLGTSFRHLNFKLAMSVLAPKIEFSNHEPLEYDKNCTSKLLGDILSPHDMKRLEAYSNNLVDYHLILDLVPILAHQYFSEKLPVTLHGGQASVLFCMGLQDKDIGAVKEELGIEREQVLSNFIKTMKKLYGFLNKVAGKEIETTLPRLKEIEMAPLSKSMDEDLAEAAKEVEEKRRAANEAIVDPKLLQKYAIDDDDNEIEKALQSGKVSGSGVISVKSSKTNAVKKEKHKESGKSKRKGADGGRSESKKKRS